MAIRIRRGKEEDLDFSKLKEAELALTTDTKKLFFCYSPGNVRRLQTAEELQNLLDASPEAYQALQQLIADLSANPNELANILSSISALESGKVSKTDLVQTDQVSNPEKVPSSAVTHALGQEIDTLNNNLESQLAEKATIKFFTDIPTTAQLLTGEVGLVFIPEIKIVSVSPINGAIDQYTFIGQGTTDIITATVDVSLDHTTVNSDNITVVGSKSGIISGTLNYDDAAKKITFIPNYNFDFNETVTITIGKGVKSANGLGTLTTDYSWAFTTFATKLDVSDVVWDGTFNGALPFIAPFKEIKTGSATLEFITEADNDYSLETKDNLKVKTYSAGDGVGMAYVDTGTLTLDADTGITTRSRLKHITGSGAFRQQVYDGAKATSILLYSNQISLGLSTNRFNISLNNKYRTLHMTVNNMEAKLYIDDNPIPVLTIPYADMPTTTSNKIQVGTTTSSVAYDEGMIDFCKFKYLEV